MLLGRYVGLNRRYGGDGCVGSTVLSVVGETRLALLRGYVYVHVQVAGVIYR